MDEVVTHGAPRGSRDEAGSARLTNDDDLVGTLLPQPTRATSRSDVIAQAALSAIHDLTHEITRVVRETATRVTEGTAMAPAMCAFLDTVAPSASPHERQRGGSQDTALAWQGRLADAEAALARAVHRASVLEERYGRALGDLSEAREHERALRAELATTLERTCAEREAISRRADQLVAAAEEQRSATAREAETARAALAAAQQASLTQRNELSLARSEATRHAAIAEEARQGREQLDAEVHLLRTRLTDAHERVRAIEVETARGAEERRRIEVAAQAETAEREARWYGQLATLQTEHARERDRAQALADELESKRMELDTLERREQRMREEVDAVAKRADADREETVRRAQEMVQAAEQARAAATAELEALRASVAGDGAVLLQMEAEHERAEQGAVEREAALAESRTVIDEIEASRAAVVAELERTCATLAATEQEFLATQHELGLAQRQLDKLCTAHDDLTEDHARLTTVFEEGRTRETDLRGRTDELREQVRSLDVERGRLAEIERQFQDLQLQQTRLSERSSEADSELERQRERVRTTDDALARATAALEQATARERRLHDELAATTQRSSDYEDTLREARGFADVAERERAVAIAETEALRTAMASSQRLILEAEEETRTARAEAERLAVAHEAALAEQRRLQTALAELSARAEPSAAARAVPVAPGAKPEPPAVVAPVDARTVVILDAQLEWPAVTGLDVHVLAPNQPVIARLKELAPGRCLVNLGAPSAVEAAAAIRASGLTMSLWGCVAAADGDRGFWVGVLDVLARPLDPDMVRAQLVGVAPKSARILAVGSDSETFIPLRQGLMKAGMSVSIAWDLKQAGELMEIVHPHVVVLDLALPARRAAAFVVELARAAAPPALIVIPGPPETLAAFSAAIGSLVPAEGARTRANLLRRATDATIKAPCA